MRLLSIPCVAFIVMAVGARAATDPSLPGPFTPGILVADIPGTAGASLSSDVHFPDDGGGVVPATAGACPVVVFGHGFSRNKSRYAEFGRHLASRGYVTIIPDFAGGSNHSRNADDLIACVDWILAENANPASRFFGRIDANALGASGHSAGGMSALVALARDPRLVAAAPMDPVDNADLGSTALATISKPVAITFSEDSACNASGSSRVLYAAANPPKRAMKIVLANHCDPEMPSDFFCTLTCGSPSAVRQSLYRKVVTGWLEMYLRCDPTYEPWVSGARVQADIAAGLVTYEASPDPPPAPCLPGGAPPGPVTGLRARKQGNDVVFTWDSMTADPAIFEYRVLRDEIATLPAPLLAGTPTLPRHDDVGLLLDGLDWFVQVRAVNSIGEGP